MENHAKSLKEILITPEEQVIIFNFSKLIIWTVFGDKDYIEVDLEITVDSVADFCNGYWIIFHDDIQYMWYESEILTSSFSSNENIESFNKLEQQGNNLICIG